MYRFSHVHVNYVDLPISMQAAILSLSRDVRVDCSTLQRKSGLGVLILEKASVCPVKAKLGDQLKVHYEGRLKDGTVFEETFKVCTGRQNGRSLLWLLWSEVYRCSCVVLGWSFAVDNWVGEVRAQRYYFDTVYTYNWRLALGTTVEACVLCPCYNFGNSFRCVYVWSFSNLSTFCFSKWHLVWCSCSIQCPPLYPVKQKRIELFQNCSGFIKLFSLISWMSSDTNCSRRLDEQPTSPSAPARWVWAPSWTSETHVHTHIGSQTVGSWGVGPLCCRFKFRQSRKVSQATWVLPFKGWFLAQRRHCCCQTVIECIVGKLQVTVDKTATL